MALSVTTSSTALNDVRAAVRSPDHVTWLGNVLEAIAIEALGCETPRRLEPIEAGRIHSVIGDPVAAAADAAFDRLAADLAHVLAGDRPALPRRSDDERRRVELGLD